MKRLILLCGFFLLCLASAISATSVPVGKTVVMTVSSDGTQPLTYKWYKNDVLLSGQTGQKLTLTNFTLADAGFYHCVVANVAGSVTTNKEELVLATAPTRGTLTTIIL